VFTGIVEELGTVVKVRTGSEGGILTIEAGKISPSLKTGDSIAVNGVCLTATGITEDRFACDLSSETLNRSSLGQSRQGMLVNLERALMAGGRLGGHFVQGHVDAVGKLLSSTSGGGGRVMEFSFPREIERYLVYKGSVAVDGISLTVATLKQRSFTVAVIPYTLQGTNLNHIKVGSAVNIEVDVLGKYVERFFRLGLVQNQTPKINWDILED